MRKDHILGPCDTDSISLCKPDYSPWTTEEKMEILDKLDSLDGELIKWEDDGVYETVVIVAAKNYVLWDGKKQKIKGSALKASNKEIYLKDFIKGVINILLDPNFTQDQIIDLYNKTAQECLNVTDISRFAFKKTFTKAVQEGDGTAELKARLALKFEQGVQQGDKFRMFYLPNKNLCLDKNFTGEYCKKTLLKKLWATVGVFDAILPQNLFTNYSLQVNYYPLTGETKPSRSKKKQQLAAPDET